MTGTQIHFSIEVAKIIREETGGSVPIVWGGCHPTILPEQTLQSEYVDIVCVGEGDETFLELVEALQRKQPLTDVKGLAYMEGPRYVFTGERPLLDVETLLPTPWELVDVEAYIHPRLIPAGKPTRAGCRSDQSGLSIPMRLLFVAPLFASANGDPCQSTNRWR